MSIDPLATAGLVTREVRTGSRDGRPTRIAVARRTYPAAQADVWDALTDPERLPRWFLPVEGELKVGGRYQTVGNAGGVIERCDAPEVLAVTWEMGPVVSWLQLGLSAGDGGTTLELVHEAPVDPEFWEQFGPGAVGVGWDLAFLGLGVYLETGAPVAKEFADSFGLTPEGTEFTRHAATAWAEAAAADGDDPEAARAAGDRTFAFYTTPPPEAAPEAAPEG